MNAGADPASWAQHRVNLGNQCPFDGILGVLADNQGAIINQGKGGIQSGSQLAGLPVGQQCQGKPHPEARYLAANHPIAALVAITGQVQM